MSSSMTSAHKRPPTGPAAALRAAGLLNDDDIRMKDSSGGAKRTPRQRIHERARPVEKMQLEGPGASKRNSLLARLKGGSTSIRGAASGSGPFVDRSGPSAQGATRGGRRGPGRASDTTRGTSGASAKSVEVLREFVTKRWNPASQYLDLERMAEDEILRKYKIDSPDSPNASRTIGPVILKLAASLEPPCRTISFANNRFTTLTTLSTLYHYLPDLANISFENNRIKNLRDLEPITSRKEGPFSKIKEIILTGNPVQETALATGKMDSYQHDVCRKFPLLQVLDQVIIPGVSFDLDISSIPPSSSSLPPPPPVTAFPTEMGPSFYGGGVDSLAAQFLTQYFTLFDTSRSSLLPAYSPSSTFSFSANYNAIPRNAKSRNFSPKENKAQRQLNWSTWRKGPRSISRINNLDLAESTLSVGAEAIIKTVNDLPATKHDLSQQSKFLVDSWPIPAMLYVPGMAGEVLFISVHGEFFESPSMGIRSFDRTFILALSPEGSPSQLAGWPCLILSDQWTIRAASSEAAWEPGPIPLGNNKVVVPQPQPTSSLSHPLPPNPTATGQLQTAPVDPALMQIPEPQRTAVMQLSAHTGLNIAFSVQCLEGNGWVMERAIANFEELKSQIPPEAFLR